MLCPPDAIVPAFGEGSCARHVAAAREAGVPFGVEELASLGLDLDTPADVVALTRELEARPRPGQADREGARDMSEELRGQLGVRPVGCPRSTRGDEGRRADRRPGRELEDGDVVVISQKVVSKAEGRVRRLSSAMPSAEARRLAAVLGKEPALVELILDESGEVLRAERGVLIVETHHGFVCANAGIDTSNLPEDGHGLPPARGPRRLRRGESAEGTMRLQRRARAPRRVVISDSFGRAWRLGQAEVAIGCAGLAPLDDWRGRPDADGRELEATLIAIADEAAAAADLVRDKDEPHPGGVVRGLDRFVTAEDGPGRGRPAPPSRRGPLPLRSGSVPVGVERLALFRRFLAAPAATAHRKS